jgi:predicted dehydrogenase
MSQPRILLIGLGRWGANHLRLLKSLPVELFVADTDPARLATSGVPETHRTTDARSLFSRIDAAVVVTPAQVHFATCRELLELGKDVFVEKPITLLAEEARVLAELATREKRILQVGHIFRFDPASLWLRDAIGQGRFGRLKMLRGKFSGFKRPRQDTGVTFADSIHFIDLFNFFLGEPPRRVQAVLGDFLGREMDDESFTTFEYRGHHGSPILATVETGYHTPGKFREVTVIGDELTAVCDYNSAQYKIKTYENRHIETGPEIKALEGAVHQLEFSPEEPLRAELSAFLSSLQTRAQPLADGWAGFESVRVVQAALASAEKGGWHDIAN